MILMRLSLEVRLFNHNPRVRQCHVLISHHIHGCVNGCVNFSIQGIHNELKRILRMMEIGMSVEKVLLVAKIIITLRIRLPNVELNTETLYITH